MNNALHWVRMWQHPRIYTHYEGEQKCSSLQTELKGLMDHTAYLILKSCGPQEDPCPIIQLSAAVLSLCPWLGPAEERQTDKGGGGGGESPHLWVFAVATETVSSLLNTCFRWHHVQELSTHDERASSILSLNPETGHWYVWVARREEGGWGVWDNDDVRITEADTQVCSSSLQWVLAGLMQSSSSDTEGYICFCLLRMWLVSLPFSPITGRKSFVAGRWGSWAFWV